MAQLFAVMAGNSIGKPQRKAGRYETDPAVCLDFTISEIPVDYHGFIIAIVSHTQHYCNMKTRETGNVTNAERDEKVRSVFSDAVQKGITGLPLKVEVSHHSCGAAIVVHLNRYESFNLRFETITGDVIFARTRKSIIAVGNLWDDGIGEKIAVTIKELVAQELFRMTGVRAANDRAA